MKKKKKSLEKHCTSVQTTLLAKKYVVDLAFPQFVTPLLSVCGFWPGFF